MQNVINSMAPFTDPLSGLPLSGGRVSFVMLDTDDETRYIDINDVDGTSLENPLPLDDSGRFTEQPFVADGVDFKMIVEKPTGHDDPEWCLVEVIFQKHESVHVDYSGSPVVDSLSELRSLEPENGTAIVLGYASAGDFCPVRVFQWVEEDLDENYGTQIKSSVEGAEGTWICSVGDVVDVRLFGINPAQLSGDDSARLSIIADGYTDSAVYFPAGNYFLSQNITFASVILDKGACMRTTGERNVIFTAGHLENRGGKFYADDVADADSFRVIPRHDGFFRTSECVGTINEFLFSGYLADAEAIVFDNAVTEGTHAKTFLDMLVIVKDGATLPTSLTFSHSTIIDLEGRRIITPNLRVGKLSINNIEYEDEQQNLHTIVRFFSGATTILDLTDGDKLHVYDAHFDQLEADAASVQALNFSVAKMATDSPRYIESNVDVDVTGFGNAGEFALVVNTKEGQINVTITKITNYQPTNYHLHFPINSSNGVLLYCTISHEDPNPDNPTGVNASWIPVAANVVVQRTEDA